MIEPSRVESELMRLPARDSVAVKLSGVAKAYPMFRSPIDRLKRTFGLRRGRVPAFFDALRGIDLTIRRGETVGILGINGAGKSTLLGIIASVITPSSGTVEVDGRVTALLELGAGFNPEWSGRQNAEFFGILNGMTPAEARSRLVQIEEFADIGPHFSQPMRTYSSGMFMRVAFAAAICVDPDILIVDEALAVGDARFQNKCFRKFDDFQKSGKTILFVTHSPDLVAQQCNRCVVMNAGRIHFDGEPKVGIILYYDLLYGAQSDKVRGSSSSDGSEMLPDVSSKPAIVQSRSSDISPSTIVIDKDNGPFKDLRVRPFYNPNEEIFGSGGATVLDVTLRQSGQAAEGVFDSGRPLQIQFSIRFERDVPSPIFGVMLKNAANITVYGLNSELANITHPAAQANDVFIAELCFDLNVPAGEYFVDFGVACRLENDEYNIMRGRFSALHIVVRSDRQFVGLTDLSGRLQAVRLPAEDKAAFLHHVA